MIKLKIKKELKHNLKLNLIIKNQYYDIYNIFIINK